MIPYTRDAIAQLRAAARNATPYDAIVAQFDWSCGMLDRVCRDHGINIAPAVIANSVTQAAVVPLLPTEQLAEFIAKLAPGHARAMRTLRAASLVSDEFIPASAVRPDDPGSRKAAKIVSTLNDKMARRRIPYSIECNHGYRLKFTGAKS